MIESRLLVAVLSLLAISLQGQTLNEKLEAKKEEFLSLAPSEKAAAYQDGIDAVSSSGIYGRAKKRGDIAPDFNLKNASGKEVRLSELLGKGPVVLTWYRGGWCPYCNLALAALQEKLPEIQAQGGTLVALSPEMPEYITDTTEKGKLAFQVLSDRGNQVAREYGIVFKMTPQVAQAMRDGPKTHERNADESDELPLAAAYVIAPNGEITYCFVDADYRRRVEPVRLVQALEALKSGAPTPEHLLRTFLEGVWNPPYDPRLVDRLTSEDFILSTAGRNLVGVSAFKHWIAGFQSKIGDLRLSILELFRDGEGDRLICRWKATGRNLGVLGTEPSGQPIELTGISVWKVRRGKLTHSWDERSDYDLLRRIENQAGERKPSELSP